MGLWYNKKKAYQKKNIDYGALKKGCIVPELSIIVPVYKVEPYLPKCIDSILSQTFTDFELILIDDGSPDRCGEICEEYAAKDDRIVVIHQANKGVSAARNAGLDIAKGKYIGFVDSDDWIEPEMYEQMLKEIQSRKTDIVFCRYAYCEENGKTISYLKECKEAFVSSEDLLSSLFEKPLVTGGVVWNTLMCKKTVCEIRFVQELPMKEDVVFLFDAFSKCHNGYFLAGVYYNFRQQTDSATRSCLSRALVNTLPGNKILLKKAIAHSKKLGRLASDKSLDDSIRFIRMIKRDPSVDERQKRRMLSKVKVFYWNVLIDSVLHRRITKAQIHGYLFDYIHT